MQHEFPMVKKLLIVQQIIPPFRVEFFRELSESSDLKLTVAAGPSSLQSARQSVLSSDSYAVIKLKNINFPFLGGLIWQSGLLRQIIKQNPDVLILEFNIRILSNLLILIYSKIFNKKLIWWGHGLGHSKSKFLKWVRICLAQQASGLILYSNMNSKIFDKYRSEKFKLVVSNNSMNTEKIKYFREPYETTTRDSILFIGRLVPHKKVSTLMFAFKSVLKFYEGKIKLVVIGEGPERPEIEKLARKLGIENFVNFAGEVTEEKLLCHFFNRSLLSVSPGAVGLSIIHSFAYGLPMIISKNETHGPEISVADIGRNSEMPQIDNPDDLGNAIISLLSNSGKLKIMSNNCLKSCDEHYSIRNMVREFRKVL